MKFVLDRERQRKSGNEITSLCHLREQLVFHCNPAVWPWARSASLWASALSDHARPPSSKAGGRISMLITRVPRPLPSAKGPWCSLCLEGRMNCLLEHSTGFSAAVSFVVAVPSPPPQVVGAPQPVAGRPSVCLLTLTFARSLPPSRGQTGGVGRASLLRTFSSVLVNVLHSCGLRDSRRSCRLPLETPGMARCVALIDRVHGVRGPQWSQGSL